MIESITIRPRRQAGRCPACHDELGTNPLLDCKQCNAIIHHDCRELLQTCPTLGCTGTFPGENKAKPENTFLHLLLACAVSFLATTATSATITIISIAFILNIAGSNVGGLLTAGLLGGLTFLASFLILLPLLAQRILEVLAKNEKSYIPDKPRP